MSASCHVASCTHDKYVQPPTTKHAHRMGHMVSHVQPQDHGSVPATALHSALLMQKLPSSFCPHVLYQTCSPHDGVPTAELLQLLAPCPHTVWHRPRSNQVQPVGSLSQVVTRATCGHKPCVGGEYATCTQSCQSPSGLQFT